MKEFIHHLTERNFSNRTVALVENGSWAPLAAKVMKGMFEKSKNLSFTDTTVTIKSALNDASLAQIDALVNELCACASSEEEAVAAPSMKKYACDICGWVYDEAAGDPSNGIAPGTKFENLPADYRCALCGVGKDHFAAE